MLDSHFATSRAERGWAARHEGILGFRYRTGARGNEL
jgi:hypothetical protein